MDLVCPLFADQRGPTSGESGTTAERESSFRTKRAGRHQDQFWALVLIHVCFQWSVLHYKHYVTEVERLLKQDPQFRAKMETSTIDEILVTRAR